MRVLRLRKVGTGVAAGYLVLVVGVALLAPLLSPYAPAQADFNAILNVPGSPGHVLGTDDLGRDLATRVMWGARSGLLVGFVSASLGAIIGTLIGMGAGIVGGLFDSILMVLVDGLLAFPTVLGALTIITLFGFGILPLALTLGIVFSPVFARIARTETLGICAEPYVEATRTLGYGNFFIAFRHVLPNIAGKLVIQATTLFALAITLEASLSYLGLGTQPPDASWGLLLKDGRTYLSTAPWLSLWPGLVLAFTVLSINVCGDALQELMNPKRDLQAAIEPTSASR